MSILAKSSDEPITDRRQLIDYFASAARPQNQWLIGCEHEKFPYRLSTLKPVSYDEPQGLRELFFAMREFGWQPIIEAGNIIGLTRDKAAITFEPGGQVELSGAPFLTLHEMADETDQHLVEINQLAEKMNIGFLGMGFHPTAKREDIAWVPKLRYGIMRNYMPKRGQLGLDMMLRTCTVQVNLDFADEADMVKKFRIGLALQPIATALFATSPFTEGKPNGFSSYRMNIWTDTDNDRSGNTPFAFETGFGYERYANYALDVPMYFVYRNGNYIDCAGQSFRDFLTGKLPALPGELPTMTDWANHLTTLFPDVRLKRIIEMRGADVGPTAMIKALPAFWVGLLYDATTIDAAWDLIKDWSQEDRDNLRRDVPKLGFQTSIRGLKAVDIAEQILMLSRQGLKNRARKNLISSDETGYLDILQELTKDRQNESDNLLSQVANDKDFTMQSLFNAYRLVAPQ
jgi:glutamate--cysteine ligase